MVGCINALGVLAQINHTANPNYMLIVNRIWQKWSW